MYAGILLILEIIYFSTVSESTTISSQINYDNYKHVRILRQAQNKRCTLPFYPPFGQWTIYDDAQRFPGQRVPSRSVLKLTCQENYKLDSYDTTVCIDGKWKPEIGKCLRTCPTIKDTQVMTATCSLNGCKLDSCDRPFDGTVARFQCARFYEDQAQELQPFRICTNGSWDGNLPSCISKCGKVSFKKDPTLIVGGDEAEKKQYPWQIALYNASDKVLLCGGTLISQRVIVTAAHCITNDKGKLMPKEMYIVAGGKYFRQYDHPNDTKEAQFSSIHEMYTARQYKAGLQNYFGDIGIIVTTQMFNVSDSVRPVCVIWDPNRHQVLTDPSRTKQAYVSGWGYTVEYEKPSDVLKHIRVPLVTDEECNRRLSEDEGEEVEYMTDDKMCAGYLNSNSSVCKGDSGGGLVIKYKKRYYIIGIVSISPHGGTMHGGCNSQLYTLYTRFSYYIEDFILEKEAQFRPRWDCVDPRNCNNIPETTSTTTTTTKTTTEATTESPTRNRCTLPNHPDFGKWSIIDATAALQPGMFVDSGIVLKFECNNNFKLVGQIAVYCNNSKWSSDFGKCLKTCPSRFSTATMRVTCIYKTKETENCNEAVEGTLAKFSCAPFYEDPQLKKRPVHICVDGEWDQPLPHCSPVCGVKTVEPTPLIVNGSNVTKGDYPWQVALYTKSEKELMCGGSLLSEKVVLTAAHCITDRRGNMGKKEDYIIAVGKYYRKFNDSRDYTEAQYSEVQAMFIPQEYHGDLQNYLGDIAILIPKETFKISRSVQPVCLDIGQNYNLVDGQSGYETGWGFTKETSSPSEILKDLRLPYVSSSKCVTNIPEDYESYLTVDKMCAGYLNKGMSGCNGDSGNGLVFKHDGRYYLTGVHSISFVSPDASHGCDSQQYSLFTKVSFYIDRFILPKLAVYKS